MVGHHDNIVYHKVQRDCDTGKRIKLDFKSQCIIQDCRNRNIYGQSRNDQKQITHVACDKCYEKQQYQHGNACAEINGIQFLRDIFGCIITGMDFISGRHHGFRFGYDFLHLLCQCKLVGGF